MVDMVIAELAEINGGEIKVVRDDAAEVEKQGITILGVPVGTPEYSARQWREVFEKKKMHLKAFEQTLNGFQQTFKRPLKGLSKACNMVLEGL